MSEIVLLGATGYTGSRTAAAMVQRGLRPVLAGRNMDKLRGVAERLGGLETRQFDVNAGATDLVAAGDVLVSTVGPFQRLGEPAVRAAIKAGAIYLDSNGEPPFIRRVFEEFGPDAAKTGAALLTSFGNDWVPGNLAGALALRDAGERAHRLEIGYFMVGGGRGQKFSKGTVRSLVGVALEPSYTFVGGTLRAEPAARRLRGFTIEGEKLNAVTVGGTEQFALPALAPALDSLDVYLGWFGKAGKVVHRTSGMAGLLGRSALIRKASAAVLTRIVGGLAEEPNPEVLAASRSHYVAEAFDAGGALLARVSLTAPDPYGMTADLLAWGAGEAAAGGVSGTGALGPVQAFGLDGLQKGAATAGIEIVP